MIDVTVAKGEPELVVTAKGLYLHRGNPGYPSLTLCGRHAAGPAGGATTSTICSAVAAHVRAGCPARSGRAAAQGTALRAMLAPGFQHALGGDHPVGHVTAAATGPQAPSHKRQPAGDARRRGRHSSWTNYRQPIAWLARGQGPGGQVGPRTADGVRVDWQSCRKDRPDGLRSRRTVLQPRLRTAWQVHREVCV